MRLSVVGCGFINAEQRESSVAFSVFGLQFNLNMQSTVQGTQ